MIFTRNYSELLFSRRIDAELYNPNYFSSLLFLRKKNYRIDKLSTVAIIKSGTTPRDRDDNLKEGPVLFKTTDIRNNILNQYAEFYHISDEIHERMKYTRVRGKDVLLNIVGATLDVIGRCAYVPDSFPEANITQAMVSLSLFNLRYQPGYIFSYLQSYFAQDQIKRIARPTGQFNLNHPEVGAIQIPCLSDDFQNRINGIIKKSSFLDNEASQAFFKAKQTFLSSLGLENWKPKHKKSYQRTFGEVQNSCRMDGEYFQPKYDEMLKIILKNAQYCKPVISFKIFNSRGTNPTYIENGGIDVVNSQHILETNLDYDNFEKTNTKFWEMEKECRVYTNDILTYMTGANVGRVGVYLSDEKAVAGIDTGILRVRDENPIYVGFALNSIVGRMQTEKHKTGSAQAHIYPQTINQYIVPFIHKKKQEQIAELYVQSYELSNQSKQLIAKAKRAVEMAIEKDEETAINALC
jgi:restriction endonuclease S subunit